MSLFTNLLKKHKPLIVLHINTPIRSRVFLFNKEMGVAKPNVDFTIKVTEGEQDLLLVSTDDDTLRCHIIYAVQSHGAKCQIIVEMNQYCDGVDYDKLATEEPTNEEIEQGVEDEHGVVYSSDGKQLLNCKNEKLEVYKVKTKCRIIRAGAFSFCQDIHTITLPKGLSNISDKAFYGCKNLSSVNLPESINHIGNWAFLNCKKLNTITLPGNLTYIGESAFRGCESLCSITLPKSLNHIGEGVFSNTNISTIDSKSPYYIFKQNCLIDESESNKKMLIHFFSDEKYVMLPQSITHIGKFAFCNRKHLTEITLPDGLIQIESGAFQDCERLTNINLPDSLAYIGNAVFISCKNLITITLPKRITRIGNQTFLWCKSLTTINIPEGVTHIEESAFCCCESLTAITLPEGLTHIGDRAFCSCKRLTTINLPESLSSIDNAVFDFCDSLSAIYIRNGTKNHFKELLTKDLHGKLIEVV